MAAPKALFIFNPFSGKGTIKNNLFDVVDSLVKEGYAVEVRPRRCWKKAPVSSFWSSPAAMAH